MKNKLMALLLEIFLDLLIVIVLASTVLVCVHFCGRTN